MSSGCAPTPVTRTSASTKNSSTSTFRGYATVTGKACAGRSRTKRASSGIFFGARPEMLFCRTGCLPGNSSSMEYEMSTKRPYLRRARPPESAARMADAHVHRQGNSGHAHPGGASRPSSLHSLVHRPAPSARATLAVLSFGDTLRTAAIRAPILARRYHSSRLRLAARLGAAELAAVWRGIGISPPHSGSHLTVTECHTK